MADWTYRELSDLRVSDKVMGYAKVSEGGPQYQLVSTKVQDIGVIVVDLSVDHVFRVTLTDGTQLVCNAEQRFWIDRMRNGKVWKVPSAPGRDTNYLPAEAINKGHLIRGRGQEIIEWIDGQKPWPFLINVSPWLPGDVDSSLDNTRQISPRMRKEMPHVMQGSRIEVVNVETGSATTFRSILTHSGNFIVEGVIARSE